MDSSVGVDPRFSSLAGAAGAAAPRPRSRVGRPMRPVAQASGGEKRHKHKKHRTCKGVEEIREEEEKRKPWNGVISNLSALRRRQQVCRTSLVKDLPLVGGSSSPSSPSLFLLLGSSVSSLSCFSPGASHSVTAILAWKGGTAPPFNFGCCRELRLIKDAWQKRESTVNAGFIASRLRSSVRVGRRRSCSC